LYVVDIINANAVEFKTNDFEKLAMKPLD